MSSLSQPRSSSTPVGDLLAGIGAVGARASGTRWVEPDFAATDGAGSEAGTGDDLCSEFRNSNSPKRHRWDPWLGASEAQLVAVTGRIVGCVGMPAAPDHAQPGPHQDADGVGVALAGGDVLGVEAGSPGRGMARVVGKDLQRLASVGVGSPAKVDPAALAGRLGDGAGAALGGGVIDVEAGIKDGSVDAVADARQAGEDAGLGVIRQDGRDRVFEFFARVVEGAQETDLMPDQFGQHLRVKPAGCGWRPAQRKLSTLLRHSLQEFTESASPP